MNPSQESLSLPSSPLRLTSSLFALCACALVLLLSGCAGNNDQLIAEVSRQMRENNEQMGILSAQLDEIEAELFLDLEEHYEPLDPGAVLASGVERFDVDGVSVIFRHTPGKPNISLGLYLRGGSVELSDSQAGIEDMLVDLMTEGGADGMSRDAFFSELEGMGASIAGAATRTETVFALSSLQRDWERSFDLFASLVTKPALPKDELERLRVRQIKYIESLTEDPDQYASLMGTDLLFEGHPFGRRTWGTLKNVKGFKVKDLHAHHKRLMEKERALIVVVGDLDPQRLQEKIKEAFGGLPKGTYKAQEIPAFAESKGRIKTFEKKSLPTDYVVAYFQAPEPGHPDYYAMLVALEILSDRLFEEIRTRRNLSYSVSAQLGKHPVNYGLLYLTSRWPTHALSQALDEVESMQSWLVNEQEITYQVAAYSTRFFMSLESLKAQRNLLAKAELQLGDWEESARIIDGLSGVTPRDIRRVMQTYLKDLQIGFYGDPARLHPALVGNNPAQADTALLRALGFKGSTPAPPKP